MIFEGNISVKSILENNRRSIDKLILKKGKRSKDIGYIVALAKKRNIPIIELEQADFNALDVGKTSGGVCLQAQSRDFTLDKDQGDFICLLEGIEDPFNLGYCMRTLYSFGCKTVCLAKKDLSRSEVQLLKSSAGAYEKMNVYLLDDCIQYLNSKKLDGFQIVGAYRKDAISCIDFSWQPKTVLIIGGQMRGMSSKVIETMDQAIYIPYALDFKNALNATSATAVLAYDYFVKTGVNHD